MSEPSPSEKEFALTLCNISASAQEKVLVIAARDVGDMEDWKNSLIECAELANNRVSAKQCSEVFSRSSAFHMRILIVRALCDYV